MGGLRGVIHQSAKLRAAVMLAKIPKIALTLVTRLLLLTQWCVLR